MQKVTEGNPLQPAAANSPVAMGDLLVKLNGILAQIGQRLNRVLPLDGSEAMTGPLPLENVTAAQLAALTPSSYRGCVVYQTDGTRGPYYSDATTWLPFATSLSGNTLGPPALASWTWVNQGAATGVQTGGTSTAIGLHIPPNAALNWRGLFKAAPTQPYGCIFGLSAVTFDNASNFGAYFYDGIKLLGVEFAGGSLDASLRVEKINNVTTDGSTASAITAIPNAFPGSLVFFKLRRDASNIYFDYSLDGWNFRNLFSEATGTFITPTQVGFGGIDAASGGAGLDISMLSYKELSNATL